MSWSEGRSKKDESSDLRAREKKLDALNSINAVLTMLAADEDLHEDLQLPLVKSAMAHWTGENRLPGDKAAKLSENLRVVSVLQKVQKLQYVCRMAGIAVPLDHMVARQPKLSASITEKYIGVTPSSRDIADNSTKPNSTQSTMNSREASSLSLFPSVTLLSDEQRAQLAIPANKLSPFSSSQIPEAESESATSADDSRAASPDPVQLVESSTNPSPSPDTISISREREGGSLSFTFLYCVVFAAVFALLSIWYHKST